MTSLPLSISTWFLKCQFGSLLQTQKKKLILNQTWFFFEFELDFYCLCSLQKSISKSNWFFDFLNLIFRNWKKIEWHSIFQKSSGDRQGDSIFLSAKLKGQEKNIAILYRSYKNAIRLTSFGSTDVRAYAGTTQFQPSTLLSTNVDAAEGT